MPRHDVISSRGATLSDLITAGQALERVDAGQGVWSLRTHAQRLRLRDLTMRCVCGRGHCTRNQPDARSWLGVQCVISVLTTRLTSGVPRACAAQIPCHMAHRREVVHHSRSLELLLMTPHGRTFTQHLLRHTVALHSRLYWHIDIQAIICMSKVRYT